MRRGDAPAGGQLASGRHVRLHRMILRLILFFNCPPNFCLLVSSDIILLSLLRADMLQSQCSRSRSHQRTRKHRSSPHADLQHPSGPTNGFANALRLYSYCRVKARLNGKCLILLRTLCIIIIGLGETFPDWGKLNVISGRVGSTY